MTHEGYRNLISSDLCTAERMTPEHIDGASFRDLYNDTRAYRDQLRHANVTGSDEAWQIARNTATRLAQTYGWRTARHIDSIAYWESCI